MTINSISFVQVIINSTHMSIDNVYDLIYTNSHLSHEEQYNELIKTYSKAIVDFVMYDLFEYEHDPSENGSLEYRPGKENEIFLITRK